MIALLAAAGLSCAQLQEVITRVHRSPDLTEEDRTEIVAVIAESMPEGCIIDAPSASRQVL